MARQILLAFFHILFTDAVAITVQIVSPIYNPCLPLNPVLDAIKRNET